ncbi:hypothetical protein DGI_2759 [Megalodesulfovibrio gigas DSM 1382 = ATCC 19364]|uniref:Uncharacterized protein n=1 Tax=Megalodesulfovibrio gigas (strain ATCC 19364 / DSM 1382 / NCIMB 9332 / VKM B-1759) TaxID=1121448 RepID=T2GD31_MEGG1|nr:hypothetical protein [Megalodesulfovibrio gigas]AGW14490.1 hypothetical protein DGI_2759 [Megalodesulfovibrio gigas DSM 1382 = ATCC 19364]
MPTPLRTAAALAVCLALAFCLFAPARAASEIKEHPASAAGKAPVLTIFFTADTKGYFDPCPT